MSYVHQPFPSVRYHRSGKTALVHSEEHHDELLASDPDNWADTPAAFREDGKPAEPAASGQEPEAEPEVDAKPKASRPRSRSAGAK